MSKNFNSPKERKGETIVRKQYTKEAGGNGYDYYDDFSKNGKYDSLFKHFKKQKPSRVFATFY